MEAKLRRYYSDSEVTLGFLQMQDISHKPIYTLENPWKDNRRNLSCIPVGTYHCKPFDGEKYKNVYEVCDVKDRSAILIHIGNYEKDTQGCILVGLGVDPARNEPMVMKSTNAMNALRTIINDNEFTLEVTECYQ